MSKKLLYMVNSLLAFLLLFIDQTTKYFAIHSLGNGKRIILIKSVLELYYTENTGAAFGLFEGKNIVIMFMVIAIVMILLFMYRRLCRAEKYQGICFVMTVLISGALGNLIDRMLYGFVVDYIYFVPIDFPRFNFADICIVSAVFMMSYLFLFVYTEEGVDCMDNNGIRREHRTFR